MMVNISNQGKPITEVPLGSVLKPPQFVNLSTGLGLGVDAGAIITANIGLKITLAHKYKGKKGKQ